jgi:CheY-like chemotaxis protein
MLHQGLILTSHRPYAHALRLGLLGLGDLQTRVDVELDAVRAMQLVPQQYDLILIDNMLDSMDGLQLLQLMKQQAPATKFIVVSDAADETSRADAYKNGADFFLERPCTPATVTIAVEAIAALLKSGQDHQLQSGEQDTPHVKITDIVQTRSFPATRSFCSCAAKAGAETFLSIAEKFFTPSIPAGAAKRLFTICVSGTEGASRSRPSS